jgi:uncharacterized protein
MKRTINRYLREWREAEKRKVLLVRGARQVGKTYSVRELGKSFEDYFEVNFEEEKGLDVFFRESLNPQKICENLSTYFSKPINPGRTLLFFDEIQACPEALASLRFFYEKIPELHLVAAGSLLEFAMSEIPSLGVGRIHSLFMYPMSFNEFLVALDEDNLLAMLQKANSKNPLASPFHKRLIEYLKIFQLIGGMPAVVKTYLEEKNIEQCQTELDDLLTTLRDDFAKYKDRSPVFRLREVFDSIVYQAGSKFKYSNIDSTSSSNSLKEALNLLVQAGLAYKIYHTSARGLPLGAQIKNKKFKVILFDVGMHQRLLGLNLKEYLLSDRLKIVNRGNLAEVFTGLELINNASPGTREPLYYWHRESRGSNAEVDYVIQEKNEIVPIEVKAGTSGQMQSMFVFLDERNLNIGIRLSLENFSEYGRIVVIPLYAVSHIVTGLLTD